MIKGDKAAEGMDKKVSIIIPAYNVCDYIAKALDSCVSQSYPNVEIVVTDDGSSDDTWAVIQKLASSDKRIIALHQENRGVSSARNPALDHASGDYVLFLDADDWLEVDAVKVLLENAARDDVLLCSDCFFAYLDANADGYIRECQIHSNSDESCSSTDAMDYIGRTSKYRLASSCYKLFSKRVIDSYHLRFAEGIHQGEDGLFTFQYLCNVDAIKYIAVPLWNILDRPGSACNSGYTVRWKTAIQAIDKMIAYRSDLPISVKERLLAFKAERAMWLLTSCVRSDAFDRGDYLLFQKLLRENGIYLIKKKKRIKTILQYCIYTRVSPKLLRWLLTAKRQKQATDTGKEV